MSSENKKNPVEKAMEKDCIILVAANMIATVVERKEEMSVKCLGPACGQYSEFINKCGFSK